MMISRRIGLLALLAAPLVVSVGAQAAVGQAFTTGAFEAAQKAGKSVLIFVHAPWCPTCRTQDQVLTKLLSESKYKGIVVLRVDFDSQKEALRQFKVQQQSTLIGFKGTRETSRQAGTTESMNIEDLLESTL